MLNKISGPLFLGLACRLSPENLCCDGEISPAQARKRFKQIKKEWADLETRFGIKVTEDDAWNWNSKNYR